MYLYLCFKSLFLLLYPSGTLQPSLACVKIIMHCNNLQIEMAVFHSGALKIIYVFYTYIRRFWIHLEYLYDTNNGRSVDLFSFTSYLFIIFIIFIKWLKCILTFTLAQFEFRPRRRSTVRAFLLVPRSGRERGWRWRCARRSGKPTDKTRSRWGGGCRMPHNRRGSRGRNPWSCRTCRQPG